MNAILSSKVIEYYFFRLILLGAIPIALIFTNDSAWIGLVLATEITRLFFSGFLFYFTFSRQRVSKNYFFFSVGVILFILCIYSVFIIQIDIFVAVLFCISIFIFAIMLLRSFNKFQDYDFVVADKNAWLTFYQYLFTAMAGQFLMSFFLLANADNIAHWIGTYKLVEICAFGPMFLLPLVDRKYFSKVLFGMLCALLIVFALIYDVFIGIFIALKILQGLSSIFFVKCGGKLTVVYNILACLIYLLFLQNALIDWGMVGIFMVDLLSLVLIWIYFIGYRRLWT